MKMTVRFRTPFQALVVLAGMGLVAHVHAQGAASTETQRPAARFESTGRAQIGGERVSYRAVVEEMFIRNPGGQRTASIVSTSYLRDDVRDADARPVVFVFNGGPGSAGLWLQMGLVGPRRVHFDDPVNPPTVPPYRLVDNADSPLDVADIVIFDPPGTGYSRVLPDGDTGDFYGIDQDARVTREFILDWVRRHQRWNSPRFLVGESYGTVRAAVVAKLLAGGPFGSGSMDAITLNGVILLGQAMNAGNGFSPANNLTAFAATAWYHGKVDREARTLEEHVQSARAFAAGEYVRALYAGSRLEPAEKEAAAQRIAALTGLPAALVLDHDLAVPADVFASSLLADSGMQVGKYDARFVLPASSSGGDPVADDPAMGQYVPAFVAALNMHLRDELGADLDRDYLAIEFHQVNGQWDYGFGPGVPRRGQHADDLAVAMRRNPALRLFVGTGWYDLVTTPGDAEYMVAHTDFPPERVSMRFYESGHMPYLGVRSRARLAADLREFIRAASQP